MARPAQAQYLVNLQTSTATGAPDPALNWSASVTDAYGYLYVIGNTQTLGANGVDVLLTCYNPDDLTQVVWQETYHRSGNTNDYGVDLVWDPNGYVVFVAASFDDTLSDYWVVKVQDTDGAEEWDALYDSEDDDIPTDLVLDGDGNVFVTGSARVGSTGYDVLTVAFNSNGTLEWYERYDGSGLLDVGARAFIDAGHLMVTGGSSVSGNEWDYILLEYNMSNGSLVGSNTTSSLFPLEQPKAVARDVWGNTFICGSARTGVSQQWDWHIVALDTGHTVIWETAWDAGDSLEDRALTLVPNDSGGVYVGGYSSRGYGKEFTVVKFDDTGDVAWYQVLPNDAGRQGQCKQLSKNYLGEVIAAGEHFGSTTGDIVGMGYAADGQVKWHKSYEVSVLPGQHPLSLSVADAGDVWITGLRLNADGPEYQSLKFSFFEPEMEVLTDSASNPTHLKNQIIIKFAPQALIDTAFLSTDKVFGSIEDFVKQPIIAALEAKGNLGNIGQSKVRKLYRKFTIADSMSITRLGDTIKVPYLWTSMVLYMPEGTSSRLPGTTEQDWADSIASLYPYVWYAEPNYVGELFVGANDDKYDDDQGSLHQVSSSQAGSNINIEPAWDMETGKPFIRVGIYDSGIRWSHNDLCDRNKDIWQESRVKGGWDYYSNSAIEFNKKNDNGIKGHGTRVTGIIGAVRNNSKGIAGIAGGNSNANPGVSLYGMKIFDGGYVDYDLATEAVLDGAFSSPTRTLGDALHLMNHSWGGSLPENFRAAMHTAYRNRVTSVNAIGNDGIRVGVFNPQTGITSGRLPGLYFGTADKISIVVGGAGSDGNYVLALENSSLVLGNVYSSNYGPSVDVIAPGILDLVITTGNDTDFSYKNFNATSAAAPHVTGLAALMKSYYDTPTPSPENLEPEDIEGIMEYSAVHLTQNYTNPATTSWPNERSGYGRIDAGAAMSFLQAPYQLHKIVYETDLNDFTLETNNATMLFTPGALSVYYTSSSATIGALPQAIVELRSNLVGQEYVVDVYKVTKNINLSLPSGATVLSSWIRGRSTNVLSGPENIASSPSKRFYGDPHFSLTNVTTSAATITGYTYHIKSQVNSSAIDVWFPFDPSEETGKFEFTVLTDQSTSNNLIQDRQEVQIYPNPASESVNISFDWAENPADISVEVLDITGKMVKKAQIFAVKGENTHQLEIRGVPSGVYSIRLFGQSGHAFFGKFLAQ